MSDWNEEKAIHKAKKIGQIDAKTIKGKGKKQPRPWKVMVNPPEFLRVIAPNPYVTHHCISKEAAEAWIEKQKRSWWMRRQDMSPRAEDEAKKDAEERANRYWIVGPDDPAR